MDSPISDRRSYCASDRARRIRLKVLRRAGDPCGGGRGTRGIESHRLRPPSTPEFGRQTPLRAFPLTRVRLRDISPQHAGELARKLLASLTEGLAARRRLCCRSRRQKATV